jgi:hypothetical protein
MAKRSRWAAVALCLLLFGQTVLVNDAASATVTVGECEMPRHGGFDGFGAFPASGSYYEGVLALINTNIPSLCHGDTNYANAVSVWVMVTPKGGNGWAQSGYSQDYGNHIRIFAQDHQNSNSGLQTTYIPPTQLYLNGGDTYQYTVQYDGNARRFWMNYGANRIQRSTFDPFYVPSSSGVPTWLGPFSEQVSGEAWHSNSGMPGTATVPTNMYNIKIQHLDESWVDPAAGYISPAETPANSYWKRQDVSSTYKRIWLG